LTDIKVNGIPGSHPFKFESRSLPWAVKTDHLYNELKENIRVHRILQPLLITDESLLLCGHNRLRIAKDLNIPQSLAK
jgi:ParB-like chromosome segregation protein Spo0J